VSRTDSTCQEGHDYRDYYPNEPMAPILSRMPAMLLPPLEHFGLDPKLTDISEAMALLTPEGSAAMMVTPVSSL